MDFRLIELNRSGKSYRNQACEHLQKAIDSLDELQTILKKQTGIGTEFLITTIDELKGSIKDCRTKMRRLK